MYRLWEPAYGATGRTLLLVGRYVRQIDEPRIAAQVSFLGPVMAVPVHAGNGAQVGEYWCRLAFGYAPVPSVTAEAEWIAVDRGADP